MKSGKFVMMLALILAASQVRAADKHPFKATGLYTETCSCKAPCACEMVGLNKGCIGVGALQLSGGSYDGKVVVREGAAKTSSRQSSRNLLLGADAAIDTRPQLEINADDVKCAHGATTGTLDEHMLFYLLTRGLDRETARALLTYAFVEDVLKLLGDGPVRQAVESRALARLPAAATIREFVA